MRKLKLTSWNIKHLGALLERDTPQATARKAGVGRVIRETNPDILCLVEGPKGEQAIERFSEEVLGGDWIPVKEERGSYAIRGTQWIWFLVRRNLAPSASLLAPEIWDSFAGGSWTVYFTKLDKQTGQRARMETTHRHYRHPQVLVLDWQGTRVEFIGLHLKSKFVRGGKSKWNAGGEAKEEFVDSAVIARSKMTTEASNVRAYIDAKFNQVEKPALFVLGDLNDGPGKEFFEQRYMLHDLISSLQGEVFFASRFLNHALFDYPDHLRWTAQFEDFVPRKRKRSVLLDHILFTQALVGGDLPLHVASGSGLVEHEVFDLVNSTLPRTAETSDHRPVSVLIETT